MKKDKLIALLQKIDGNPYIYLWNGYVEDYMDVGELQESLLVKQSKTHVYKHMCFDYMRDTGRFELTQEEEAALKLEAADAWKKHYSEWEFPSPFVNEQDFAEWYDKQKKVYLITAKPRGKTSWSRTGDTEY